jgi:hypothetical protein
VSFQQHHGALTHEERGFFGSQLVRFGLSLDDHVERVLVVPQDATISIGPHTNDAGSHVRYATKDLAQFKRWVGNPDSIYDDGTAYPHPVPAFAVNANKRTEDLTDADHTALVDAAKGYVWGPSHQFAAFKPHVEQHLELATNVSVYTTLVVNGILNLPNGPSNTIVANKIVYGPNGKITSPFPLTIYATTIQTAL